MNYYQQGDVILKECAKPAGVSIQNTDLLWKGQNHHHRLRGKFAIGKVGEQVFVHSKGCEIFHEEHRAFKIEPGFYRLEIVKEYSHWDEEARNVID